MIAVTGASGFIGGATTGALLAGGCSVRPLSRQPAESGTMRVDYADPAALQRAFDGARLVIHVAGLAHVDPRTLSDPAAQYEHANAATAEAVATACIRAGVPRLVLMSSAGVLGKESPPGGFDDDSPADPYDWYTESKHRGEQRVAAIAARDGLHVAILRPPTVYGPQAPGSFGRMHRWIMRGWPLPIGSVTARRSFVGIRNLCDCLLTLARSEWSGVASFLIADGPPLSARELAAAIAGACRRPVRLLPVPLSVLSVALAAAGRSAEYRRLCGRFELHPFRLAQRLAWRPPYTCSDEIAWAVSA